jgi:hypothetical protein
MRRRAFIGGFGAAAAQSVWPAPAQAEIPHVAISGPGSKSRTWAARACARDCKIAVRPWPQPHSGGALRRGGPLTHADARIGASGARRRRAGDRDFALIQAHTLTATVPNMRTA